MITYSPPLYSTHTMIIAAIIPYSFSFCFSISHFNFCASERNNYASRLPSSSTSAVSAKASVLSTIMSSFSPRSMILSDDHPFPCTSYRCYRSLRPSLHPISAARASQRRRWGRSTSSNHQLSDRRGEIRHSKRLSGLSTVSGSEQRVIQPTHR